MEPVNLLIGYDEEYDHLTRRLGAAIVALWDQLSESDQRAILQQAEIVGDRKPAVELEQQLKAFIRKHNQAERYEAARSN